jgi:hypothetical protein
MSGLYSIHDRTMNALEAVVEIRIGRGNRNTCTEPIPLPFCPPKSHMTCPDMNPSHQGGEVTA